MICFGPGNSILSIRPNPYFKSDLPNTVAILMYLAGFMFVPVGAWLIGGFDPRTVIMVAVGIILLRMALFGIRW